MNDIEVFLSLFDPCGGAYIPFYLLQVCRVPDDLLLFYPRYPVLHLVLVAPQLDAVPGRTS